jgi:very-short-patch-repair endonuclease
MTNHKNNLTYNANFKIFENANSLKKTMTEAEVILWARLRNKKLLNTKFRRQHPINRFIVDFYSHENKLVIELDGDIHDISEIKEHDENRSAELENLGLKIVRFKNEEVFKDIELVLEKIESAIVNSFL